MISDIVLVGLLDEVFQENMRYIKTSAVDVIHDGKNVVSLIPTMYWTRSKSNPLILTKKGTSIIIRGHLESDDKLGLYVLAETIHLSI